MRKRIVAVLLLGLLVVPGCFPKAINGEIKGRVYAGEGKMSTIDPAGDYAPGGEPALPGAKVLLAFDEKGTDPVPGFETESGPKGEYRIVTKGLPPAKGGILYYLAVRKEGYQPLVYPVSSKYRINAVVLVPVQGNEKER